MTREEAITALGDRNNLLWGMSKEEKKHYSEALDMAISALSENKGDLISRQAVLDGIAEWIVNGYADSEADCSHISSLVTHLPSVEIKGEWIPVTERLPEEKINPITQDFYEYQCTFKSDDVYDVRSYEFGKGHWWNGCGIVDEYVIAWMPLPEPYREERTEE